MKNNLLFVFFFTLIISSVAFKAPTNLNTNSWSISIGKNQILNSAKNKLGELVLVTKHKLKSNDTLFAQRYICGQSALNSKTSLVIKNQNNKTICTSKSISKSYVNYAAQIALSEILNSKINSDEILNVYFTIDRTNQKPETLLLGKLKFK